MKKDSGQKRDQTENWQLSTQLIRGGSWRSSLGETSEAIFMTSGFAYDCAEDAAARFAGEQDGYTYSRLRNPTVAMFEDRMALIEGADVARATATGMAAISSALLALVKAGDHVVSSRALFGSCRYVIETILPQFGVAVTLVDGTDKAAWEAAFRPNTSVVFLETPANPTLDVVDISFVATLAHDHGALVVVDNAFASPVLQKPMTFGADVVAYSATKHIDGQGRCLGGCILTGKTLMEERILPYLRHTGPNMSPFNAWVLLKALETLDMRVERMCDTAAALVDNLIADGGFEAVRYPGHKNFAQYDLARTQMSRGGSMIALVVPGGRAQAFQFLNSLKIIDISNNLGDSKSLMTHPASTTHANVAAETRAEVGIGEGLLRLSVGLEHPDDLMGDLRQAAKKAGL